MDQQLKDMMGLGKDEAKEKEAKIQVHETGEIELVPEGQSEPVRYMVKPLRELYAPGTDSPSVDP